MKIPLVSIIIPSYNRKISLTRLIKSIVTNSYKNIEIIVVDDASTDGTYEYIKQEYKKNKKVKILRNNKNLHTATSKNLGASKAKGELFFFIDDDNVLSKTLISNLVKTITSSERIGEVGPVIYYLDDPRRIMWSQTNRNMFTSKTNTNLTPKNVRNNAWDTDDIPNAYMVKAKVVRENNITFNDALGIMYEESDYAYKIRKQGYSVKVVGSAKIYHDIPLSNNDKIALQHTMLDKRRIYYTARNRLLFHADYSTKIQLVGILLFWNWLFAGFYLYNIIAYSGAGKFSFFSKLRLIHAYLHGMIDGLWYAVAKI